MCVVVYIYTNICVGFMLSMPPAGCKKKLLHEELPLEELWKLHTLKMNETAVRGFTKPLMSSAKTSGKIGDNPVFYKDATWHS